MNIPVVISLFVQCASPPFKKFFNKSFQKLGIFHLFLDISVEPHEGLADDKTEEQCPATKIIRSSRYFR